MAWTKEVHYFSQDTLFHRGKAHIRDYHQYFVDCGLSHQYGEATPKYIDAPEAIQRIANYNPSVRLILILRNPIDRAYSQWSMYHPESPIAAFRRELELELSAGEDDLAKKAKGRGYLRRGRYDVQLRRLYEVFPRQQVLVIKYEEFLSDNVAVLSRVHAFLGLDAMEIGQVQKRHVTAYQHPLPATDREWLLAHFEESIQGVEALLDWDCSDWRSA